MKINTQRKITKGLNLLIVVLFSGCIALTAFAHFMNGIIAFSLIVVLCLSSFLMLVLYQKEKWKLGSFFYILNLLGLVILPIVRLVGTSFREGYLETITITVPLMVLIIWNEKVIKA